jgi:hypothetical protein
VKRRFNPGAFAATAILAGLVAAGTAAFAPPARAQQSAEPLRVTANKAAIVRLAGRAQNIIVGDPRVADITVENRSMLVLFGRQPGETNLIVLDSQNKEILSVPVVVTAEKDRHVSVVAVTKAGYTEVVYNCAERCVKLAEQTAAAPVASGGGPQAPVPEAPAAAPPAPAAAQPQTPEQAPAETQGRRGYRR